MVTSSSDYWRETSSGLLVPSSSNLAINEERPIGIDLFCGAGGMSLGFLQAGYEVVAACDNWPSAVITYLMNLGAYPVEMHYCSPGDKERLNAEMEKTLVDKRKGLYSMPVSGSARDPRYPGVSHFFFGDVRKLTGEKILRAIGKERGEVDCVFGGPPCQGFSTAGKRNVMDPRNSLVFDFARLVLEIQPKTMVFENVLGLLSMVTPEGLPVVDALCRILEDGGFGTVEALKRSLLASSGAGAAVKGKKVQNSPRRKQKPAEPQPSAPQ